MNIRRFSWPTTLFEQCLFVVPSQALIQRHFVWIQQCGYCYLLLLKLTNVAYWLQAILSLTHKALTVTQPTSLAYTSTVKIKLLFNPRIANLFLHTHYANGGGKIHPQDYLELQDTYGQNFNGYTPMFSRSSCLMVLSTISQEVALYRK